MEEKELNQLMEGIAKKNGEAIREAVKTELQTATAGLMKSDELGSKLEAIGISAKVIKELTEAVEKQGLEMNKFFEKQSDEMPWQEKLDKHKDEIMKAAQGGHSFKLSIPANQVRKDTVVRADVSGSTIGMRISEIGQLPYMGTVMRPLFRQRTLGPGMGGVVYYIDQASITRSAAGVEENPEAGKPESAIDWIQRSKPLEVIADTIPVSKQAWRDFDFIKDELNTLLNVNLRLKVDQQLFAGNGTPPQLSGVYTTAPTFNAGAYSGPTALDATLYDLIAVLKVQITNGKQSKYMPNTVVLNPADVLRYKLAKGSNAHYVLPPFIAANGQVIDGMRVVESSQVTANTLLLGDFNYGTVFTGDNINVEFGHIDKQFVQNTFTILAEESLLLLIRNVDADAFLKVTDIDAAIDAVTTAAPSV